MPSISSTPTSLSVLEVSHGERIQESSDPRCKMQKKMVPNVLGWCIIRAVTVPGWLSSGAHTRFLSEACTVSLFFLLLLPLLFLLSSPDISSSGTVPRGEAVLVIRRSVRQEHSGAPGQNGG